LTVVCKRATVNGSSLYVESISTRMPAHARRNTSTGTPESSASRISKSTRATVFSRVSERNHRRNHDIALRGSISMYTASARMRSPGCTWDNTRKFTLTSLLPLIA